MAYDGGEGKGFKARDKAASGISSDSSGKGGETGRKSLVSAVDFSGVLDYIRLIFYETTEMCKEVEAVILSARQGIAIVIASAAMWGISGVFGQFLFQNYHTDPMWLITVRQVIAGLVFLGYVVYHGKEDILSIWKNRADVKELLVFSLLGLLGAQYGFYYTINLANAATATILQYEAPIFVILWEAVRRKKIPARKEIFGIFLAVAGVFLISTHGRPDELVLSPLALGMGIFSAVALAIYTVCPSNILRKYSTTLIIGWGQLLSGLALVPFMRSFSSNTAWDAASVSAVIYIILGGTIIPYTLFLLGLKIIGPTKASLVSCFEPLCSILCVVVVLGTTLASPDILGMACIIATVVMLSIQKTQHAPKVNHTTAS